MGRQGFGQNLQGANLKKFGGLPGRLEVPGVQVVAVGDVAGWRLDKARQTANNHDAEHAAKGTCKGGDADVDVREITARGNIDAVIISTEDHWHVAMGILIPRPGMRCGALIQNPSNPSDPANS